MKRHSTSTAALWQAVNHPLTLLTPAMGCVGAWVWWRGTPVAQTATGLGARGVAALLLATPILAVFRALDEMLVDWHVAAPRLGRARRLASGPYPVALPDWLRHCSVLVGLECDLGSDEQPAAVLYRSRLQRCLRSLLSWGLALLTTCLAAVVLEPAATTRGVLVLGQPTLLAGQDVVLTLQEVLVASHGGGLRATEARTTMARSGAERQLTIGRWPGVIAAGQWVRLGGSLPAASVQARQRSGRVLVAQAIDGPRAPSQRARVAFDDHEQEQLVVVAEAGLLLRLIQRFEQAGGSALYVEALDGQSGRVLTSAQVLSPTTLAANHTTIQVVPEVAVVIQSLSLPLAMLGLLSAIALLVGLIAQLCWPVRRAWLAWTANEETWLLDAHHLPWDGRWLLSLEAALDVSDRRSVT